MVVEASAVVGPGAGTVVAVVVVEAVAAAGASARASLINNQELWDFFRDVPPLGFGFAFATFLGFAMMFVRIKRRRNTRKTIRYWNGMKVTAIVASWISFMMIKTFYHIFNFGGTQASTAEAGVEKIVKTTLGAATLTALAIAGFSKLCNGRNSKRSGRRHHHRHHHLHS